MLNKHILLILSLFEVYLSFVKEKKLNLAFIKFHKLFFLRVFPLFESFFIKFSNHKAVYFTAEVETMNKKMSISIMAVLLMFIGGAIASQWEPTLRYSKLCNHADVNDDLIVNALDLSEVRFSYQDGCNPGNDWCSETDQNLDGRTDEQDSMIIGGWIGKECPVL